MNAQAATHPLSPLRMHLEAIHAADDADGLRHVLSGAHLPAIGGDQSPAELIAEAAFLPPYERRFVEGLARLCVPLCELAAEDDYFAFNLFMLAVYLPAEPALFEALDGLETALPAALTPQWRNALADQQTDDRREPYWFGIIAPYNPDAGLTADEWRGHILSAWHGLLWIPPPEHERERWQSCFLPRVAKGLEALYRAVADDDECDSVMRYALACLDRAYPRDPDSWMEAFEPGRSRWPEPLWRHVVAQWGPVDADGWYPSAGGIADETAPYAESHEDPPET